MWCLLVLFCNFLLTLNYFSFCFGLSLVLFSKAWWELQADFSKCWSHGTEQFPLGTLACQWLCSWSAEDQPQLRVGRRRPPRQSHTARRQTQFITGRFKMQIKDLLIFNSESSKSPPRVQAPPEPSSHQRPRPSTDSTLLSQAWLSRTLVLPGTPSSPLSPRGEQLSPACSLRGA